VTATRLWLLRVVALMPGYWLLRDAATPFGLPHLAGVGVPYAGCVAALWLFPRRRLAGARASRRVALGLALLLLVLLAAWTATASGPSTRLVLLAATIAAAAALSAPVLLATIALALSLGGLELFLRARPDVLPYAVRLSLPLADRLACLFPTPGGCLRAEDLQTFPRDVAFAYKPHLDVEMKHREAGYWTLETDARGFVNRDESLYRSADAVVLGDSFMQGVLVDFEESFPQRLAARAGLRVLNLGVAGYDAYQYPLVLRAHGLAARPRVVIAALFGSNDWNARFPLYARFIAEHPEGDYLAFLDAQLRRGGAGTGTLLDLPARLYDGSYLVGAVRGILDPSRTGGAAETDYDEVMLGGRPVRVRLREALRLWRAIRPEGMIAAHQAGIEQLERSLTELRSMADGLGARLVVLYVPAMEEIYLPLLDPADAIWAGTPKAAVLEKLARVGAVIRERAGATELLDPTAPLQALAQRGEQLYWIHDPHWNRRGNAAVAEIVARYLGDAGIR
jgi:hypothetical protein